MKLLGSQTSPFVRKVRVVLAEKQLDYQFVLENVWAADTHIKAFNPLGQVPCLVIPGIHPGEENALFDSSVIVEYLDSLSPVNPLIPTAGRERLAVKTWEALADGVIDATVSAMLENTWAGRSESQRCAAWVQRQMSKVDSALAAMNRALGKQPYCSGTHLNLSDIATGCALGYLDLRFPTLDWRNTHTNLARLYDQLAARPSFVQTQPS